MAVRIKKSAAVESLSITPLIDVVFLLLVFFLVATRFAEEDRELEVSLPSASEAQPLVATPKQIFVNIDRDGKFFMNGRTIDIVEVERTLMQAAANNPAGQSVVIRADKRVPLDAAVQAMNACNKAKIRDYKLTTSGDN